MYFYNIDACVYVENIKLIYTIRVSTRVFSVEVSYVVVSSVVVSSVVVSSAVVSLLL